MIDFKNKGGRDFNKANQVGMYRDFTLKPWMQKKIHHVKIQTSMGVDTFFSRILSYFCFFVAAFRPCQGRLNAETKQSVICQRK